MGKGKNWKVRAPYLWPVAVLGAVVVYKYGMAVNRGEISHELNSLINTSLFVLAAVFFVVFGRNMERRALGKFVTERFRLQSGEQMLFRANFMSGEYYPNALEFNPRPRLRELLHASPFAARRLLKIRLTNSRLVVGTILGHTWRIIPLTSIRKVSDVQGRYPYRHALLIEYEFEDRAEGILVWNRSDTGQEFTRAVQAALKSG